VDQDLVEESLEEVEVEAVVLEQEASQSLMLRLQQMFHLR
jgi:hypothetical protein